MTSSGIDTAFVETKQYHRFKEFCDACRKYKYIGLCYGTPGVGKTLLAHHHANWDKVASYKPLQSSRLLDLPGVLGSSAALYTATVVNSAGHVAKDIAALRKQLRDILIDDLYQQQDKRLEEVKQRETEEKDALRAQRGTTYRMFQERYNRKLCMA